MSCKSQIAEGKYGKWYILFHRLFYVFLKITPLSHELKQLSQGERFFTLEPFGIFSLGLSKSEHTFHTLKISIY